MTVEIAPGPASMRIPRGMIPTSSFSIPSAFCTAASRCALRQPYVTRVSVLHITLRHSTTTNATPLGCPCTEAQKWRHRERRMYVQGHHHKTDQPALERPHHPTTSPPAPLFFF